MSGKNQRDGMVFPFRWVACLRELEDVSLRWEMVEAAVAYAERGETPAFRGALAALWHEFADRIDHDRNQYEAICERNRRNGRKGGRPAKKTTVPNEREEPGGLFRNPEEPEKAEGDGDGDGKGDGKGDGDVNIAEMSEDGSSSISPPKPGRSGNSGTTRPEKIFFDYEGDSRIHGLTPEQLALWEENFPALDIREEILKAAVWLDANRRQRKHDVRRFLANWLMRAQEKTRSDARGGPRDFDLGVLPEKRRRWSDHERGMTSWLSRTDS